LLFFNDELFKEMIKANLRVIVIGVFDNKQVESLFIETFPKNVSFSFPLMEKKQKIKPVR